MYIKVNTAAIIEYAATLLWSAEPRHSNPDIKTHVKDNNMSNTYYGKELSMARTNQRDHVFSALHLTIILTVYSAEVCHHSDHLSILHTSTPITAIENIHVTSKAIQLSFSDSICTNPLAQMDTIQAFFTYPTLFYRFHLRTFSTIPRAKASFWMTGCGHRRTLSSRQATHRVNNYQQISLASLECIIRDSIATYLHGN